jgi:outer membrane protein OmpA-like peptidoglycan-associated protein
MFVASTPTLRTPTKVDTIATMTARLLLIGVFGLGASLVGTDDAGTIKANQAEACGVKVAVKAAPPKRSLRRTAKRSSPIKRGDSRVAVRTRVNTKSERTPIAAGQGVQARAATTSNKRRVSKPKLRPKATPKPQPEPEQIAATEPEPEPEIAPAPEPEPEPVRAAPKRSAASSEIFFDTGEFELSSGGEAELQSIVSWLQANPKGKVIIEGHTDPVGSSARNKALSARRARSVQAFLSSAASVPKSRLPVRGYGETKLRYPRNSPKNRRVLVKTR